MFENCVKLINFGRDLSIDIDFNELLRSLNTNLNIQHSPNDPSNGLYPMHTVASMGYHSNTSIYIKTDTIRIGDYFTTIFSDKKCFWGTKNIFWGGKHTFFIPPKSF